MPENESNDLSPELLRETGRASAIQDLASQAQRMGDRASALEQATQRALNAQVKRWKRTSGLLGIGIAVLMVIGAINLNTSRTNQRILDDVDQLVEFVENTQEQPPDPTLRQALQSAIETRDLICRSTDPGLQAACTDLGG